MSRHMLIHSKKGFQCSHCSKCYSQHGKLKVHTIYHHPDVKPISSKKSLVWAYCSKIFRQSFNFKRHMVVWKKSVEATKSDMEAMMLEMIQAERQYHQSWTWGRQFQHFCMQMSTCQKNHCQMNTRKLWKCIDSHKSGMCQSMSMLHWNHDKRNYSHSFNNLPMGRLFGSSAKREEKERPSFKTASSTTTVVDVWLWLTLLLVRRTFPISCQSSHWVTRTSFSSITPCSTAETIAYDMLEGIKDGHKVSARYDTWALFFKTPNTVIVFSTNFQWKGLSRKPGGAFMQP